MTEPSKALVPAQPEADSALESAIRLVLDSLVSPNSKASYAFALNRFIGWYREKWRGPFTRACVHAYRSHLQEAGLAAASINARIAPVKKLALEAADNGSLPYEMAAAIDRVKGVPNAGGRTGVWLDKEQAIELLKLPDTSTLVGKRDYALLSVLIGSGLRRQEACDLTFQHIQKRDSRWCICDLRGKGGRRRTVPISDSTKAAIDEWARAAGITEAGIVFRPAYGKSTQGKERMMEGQKLTPQAVWNRVKKYGKALGVLIAPHDLRRSFAKLSHKGGADVHQIQRSLGHSSLVTTQTYLGVDQSLTDAPADHLGIDFSPRDLPIAGFAAIRSKQKKAEARPRGSKKPGGSEAQ